MKEKLRCDKRTDLQHLSRKSAQRINEEKTVAKQITVSQNRGQLHTQSWKFAVKTIPICSGQTHFKCGFMNKSQKDTYPARQPYNSSSDNPHLVCCP